VGNVGQHRRLQIGRRVVVGRHAERRDEPFRVDAQYLRRRKQHDCRCDSVDLAKVIQLEPLDAALVFWLEAARRAGRRQIELNQQIERH
jgi:hypothetical protein